MDAQSPKLECQYCDAIFTPYRPEPYSEDPTCADCLHELLAPSDPHAECLYFVAVTSPGFLNVRKEPDIHSDPVGILKPNRWTDLAYEVLEEAKAADGTLWGRIATPKGWIMLNYTTKVE